MRDLIDQKNCCEIDVDHFYSLLLITCNIAVKRPKNLAAFINSKTKMESHIFENPLQVDDNFILTANQHFIIQLMEIFYVLHIIRPHKPELWPVLMPGLRNTENVVFAFIEIIHSYVMTEFANLNSVRPLIDLDFHFLFSDDQAIAFTARNAISKVLKTRERKKKLLVSNSPIESTLFFFSNLSKFSFLSKNLLKFSGIEIGTAFGTE